MLWSLIILFGVIFVQVLMIGICFSNLILDIKECDITYNIDKKNKIDIKNLKFSIDVYIFRKIKIFSIKIHENYCEILKIKIHLNVLKKLKDDKQSGIIFIIKNIGKLEPEIKKVNLDLNIGTENVMLTVFLVPTISIIISMLINNYKDEKSKKELYKLNVMPKYLSKNLFSFKLSTQISFDTITTLFFIKKHRDIKE